MKDWISQSEHDKAVEMARSWERSWKHRLEEGDEERAGICKSQGEGWLRTLYWTDTSRPSLERKQSGALRAVLGTQLRLGLDRRLKDAREQPVPVRDALRPGRAAEPLLGVFRVALAGLFGANPVLHVVCREVADGGLVHAAGRVDVA
ncbi:hypothetical protein N566_17330 [Streptomycetaceae bacterium MP113-05]|nr:hypothetical protein N566_17330 [Streptomycetaceae bacterium MP113-05]